MVESCAVVVLEESAVDATAAIGVVLVQLVKIAPVNERAARME